MLLGIGLLLLGFIYGYALDISLCARTQKQAVSVALGIYPCCGGKRAIQWPIVSAFFLRLKCPRCGSYWPARSAILQWTSGFLFFESFFIYGLSVRMGCALVLCAFLLAAAAFDIIERIIPNPLTLLGVALGLSVNALSAVAMSSFTDALIGLAAGAVPLLVLAGAGFLLTHKPSLGGGDIKLMGMVGAFLGWRLTALSLMLGAISGGVIVAVLLAAGKIKRGTAVPYAPMLALGSAIATLYGADIMQWYFGLFM